MSLACDSCRAPFTASDINQELGIATCRACGAVFDLRSRSRASDVPPRPYHRGRIPLPAKFKVDESPGVLKMSWRWFRAQTLFLLFFCVAWDSFLLFWYGIALTAKQTPWIMVIFPIAHVAVGVGLTYSTVASLFNTTVVEVGRDTLRVKHGPIPWRGNLKLAAEDVMQIFCDEKVTRGKNGSTVTYQVNAVLYGNRTVSLVSGLEDRQQALYLEQAIENRLRITDVPVAGELPRSGSSAVA